MKDTENTTPDNIETAIITLLETTEMRAGEIAKELGTTPQKVTQVKKRYLKSGLGDKVEAMLEATGIKKLVEWATDGADCGCEERKQKLNMIGKYKVQRCLEKSQYEYIDRFFKTWDGYTGPDYHTLNELAKIRNSVFAIKYQKPNPMCKACVLGIINPLQKLHEQYIPNEE